MAENGDGGRLPAPLDVLTSDVHSRLEFHKYAYIDCVGIKNVLDCVIEEKGKLQQEQNGMYFCVFLWSLISFTVYTVIISV